MDSENEEQPRFYSQAAAAAMHAELERQRDIIRRLEILNGALNREADRQAAANDRLRAEVELWRGRYTRISGDT
ncbi:MAG: hypothetical protein JSS74_04050 [Actinobacteria bacterium]|nr:hypothetical protein [Actinomycetota bacterium]